MKIVKKGNVLFFPNLAQRHLELAYEARDRGRYQEAQNHFQKVLQLDPDHYPAMIGLNMAYYEQGMYREAVELAEQLLVSGIGEISEVLHFFIASSLQLEEYEKICEVLTSVLKNIPLPPEKVMEFEEILETCLVMRENHPEIGEENDLLRNTVEEKLEEDPTYVERLLDQLNDPEFDQQLQAIEQLQYVEKEVVVQGFKVFLKNPDYDPILKTFALKALKRFNLTEKVEVVKFDQKFLLDVSDIQALEDESADQNNVLNCLYETSYHEDPVLVSFAEQLWKDYLYASFPIQPIIKKPNSWAAALHLAAGELLSQSFSKRQIAELYKITPMTLNKKYSQLNEILHQHLPKN
ncbi:tetratricopeptide repeat protein [Ammoniphilus resinae]|uniref:Tetratricopeptide (TPR) repeat protein n=1 Tax=Ammoniphilus resinae TaxID=861532 RepID=A0ABS4GJF5_9BACL|nr:tetratricopeptide repeat protein [Ammoniphilus resinae]MBP1930376.1 tetratricopeptide (TPR) repeat protein [Ammoniphilus resinae]